ncbi:MAG: hypothetical protein FWD87_06715 [Spirochaetaceae bacterium]|nr:hypothetical protein [Spirochaetaceae bacterium]
MGNAKQLCEELDKILSGISNFNITPETMGKLEKISADADGFGMKTGKRLVDNFVEVLKSFQAGKSGEDSVSLRLTALEFYKKNILESTSETEEEL